MFYIYEITNTINDKTYIGQHETNNLADTYMGSGRYLKNAKKKYGIENFSKKIIAICETQENADILEKVFISLYRMEGKAEYNIAEGGYGGNPFEFMSEERKKEIRLRIREHNKGKHHTEETKKIIAKASSEHWKREGFKERVGKKISESGKGRKIGKCWNKGKTTGFHWFNDGIENVLSKECPKGFVKGRLVSDKEIERLKTVNIGKTHIITDETKKKISETHKRNPNRAMLGRKHSEETKRKMSESAKNKIVTEETKKKISEYMKGKKMKVIDGKRTWV